MIDKGQWWEFGQDTGITPLLFTRSAMRFLMTTESQDLGLTSHPKDGACWPYSIPVTIVGLPASANFSKQHILAQFGPLNKTEVFVLHIPTI